MPTYFIFDPFKSSLMSRLTSEWNELRKALFASQELSVPTGIILEEANNEMKNTMTYRKHLYKELEVERLVGNLRKKKKEFYSR